MCRSYTGYAILHSEVNIWPSRSHRQVTGSRDLQPLASSKRRHWTMSSRRCAPHPLLPTDAGDGLALEATGGARVRGRQAPAHGRQGPQGPQGQQGQQGQVRSAPHRHGHGASASTLPPADRELQRVPVVRSQPATREFRRHAPQQAQPSHLSSSFHRQPHPRPRPKTYQSIHRGSHTMVGKVSERVLAREGKCFGNATRP